MPDIHIKLETFYTKSTINNCGETLLNVEKFQRNQNNYLGVTARILIHHRRSLFAILFHGFPLVETKKPTRRVFENVGYPLSY